MRVMKHNDEIIRSVSTFKKYNNVLSEIVSEDSRFHNDRFLDEPIYCGKFTAKIFLGQRIIGTYEFDCTHYKNYMQYDKLTPKLKKIK